MPISLTLDVGGTSSDIALIWDAKPRLTTEWYIEFGVPVRLPSVDIHTIGAGGARLRMSTPVACSTLGPRAPVPILARPATDGEARTRQPRMPSSFSRG